MVLTNTVVEPGICTTSDMPSTCCVLGWESMEENWRN